MGIRTGHTYRAYVEEVSSAHGQQKFVYLREGIRKRHTQRAYVEQPLMGDGIFVRAYVKGHT